MTIALLATTVFAQAPAPAATQTGPSAQAGVQARAAGHAENEIDPQPQAPVPAREANIWNGRKHQPTEPQVQQDEQAAGIAASPSQSHSTAVTEDRLNRQLLATPHN
jgi:hypothetical protein